MESNMPRPPQRLFNADLVEKTRKPAGKLTQLKAGEEPVTRRRRDRKKEEEESKSPKASAQPTSPFIDKAPPFTEALKNVEQIPGIESVSPPPSPVIPGGKVSVSKMSQPIESKEVRDAANPLTPPKELINLAKNKSGPVQKALASNNATPSKVLVSLSKTKDAEIALSLIKNPSFPVAKLGTFLKLAKDDKRVFMALKSRKNLPPKILKSLEKMK